MEHSQLQNSSQGFFIFADDSTALGTGKTGLTITTLIAKSSATTNVISPEISEVGLGWYWVVPLAAHRDTLGRNLWQFSATGAIIAGRVEKIVAVNDQVAVFGASTFDHTADEVTTDADSRTASRADVSGLATPDNVTDAQTALATAIDGKLTTERLTTIDNLPSAWPTNLSLLSIDGAGRVTLNMTQMTELLSDDDIGTIATTIIASFNQTSDVPIITQATATVDRLKADATFLALVADALAAKTAAQAANTATTALSLALDTVPNAAENALAAREELAPELALIDAAISSSGLDEAGVRSAIGLESANLDTQLGGIGTALVNSPTINGGFTSDDRTKLNAIKSKTDTIGAGAVTSSSPVAASGTINGPLIIGDDYLAANGRSLEWLIDPVAGIELANVKTYIGFGRPRTTPINREGSVSESGDKWLLKFELPRDFTSLFEAGKYDWSVEVRDTVTGEQITRVRNAANNYRIEAVAKQTAVANG